MSKFMDFVVNGGDNVAKMEAELEYMGGCLEFELAESAKTRAAFLRFIQRENECKSTGTWCREWTKCGCLLEMQQLVADEQAQDRKP